jgi:hypothetical protein
VNRPKVAKRFFATPIDRRTHRDIIRDPSTGKTKVEGHYDCICGKRLQAFLPRNAVVRYGRRRDLEVFFDK